MEVDKEIKKTNNALTDGQLREWCTKQKLPFNMVDLINLNKNRNNLAYVYTGSEKNEANKGNTHHWLFQDGKTIYDSYGDENGYNLPEGFHIAKNLPVKRQQEYGTVVCGEYCSARYRFLKDNPDLDEEEIAERFADEYSITSNRKKNDENIYLWFQESSQ